MGSVKFCLVFVLCSSVDAFEKQAAFSSSYHSVSITEIQAFFPLCTSGSVSVIEMQTFSIFCCCFVWILVLLLLLFCFCLFAWTHFCVSPWNSDPVVCLAFSFTCALSMISVVSFLSSYLSNHQHEPLILPNKHSTFSPLHTASNLHITKWVELDFRRKFSGAWFQKKVATSKSKVINKY